ncbi:actin-like ATPase domain-containing protein [Rhizodiscina lignyota]|uniref:Actin-like ATPase domain-containing protein n=1 Tax=Rhizodiscina lignyota TaxID=1504668 RepID=A0A9P4M2W3_9PEZI|nr:actin-like ATPase domain-containing protein [Rhizodiscina lignyota]
MANVGASTRLVFAVDYGTTFTDTYDPSRQINFCTDYDIRFAHGQVRDGDTGLDFRQIRAITSWPGNQGTYSGEKVPSEISYESAPDAAKQWGANIYPGSLTVAFTKLEFEPQDRVEELKSILSALKGMMNLKFAELRKAPGGFPKYPARTAVEIATNFLMKIREYVTDELDRDNSRNETVRQTVPIDLVVTIPAEWSAPARNRTFQAVTQAGFDQMNFPTLHQIIFVSEPEAAALYTLTEVHRQGHLRIREGDSFILCDAGGGTADVISYRITSVTPEFRMAQIGWAGSSRCGASFIDREFRKWLQRKLGEDIYSKLAQESPEQDLSAHKVMGPDLRRVMSEFEPIKRAFGDPSAAKENYIELPNSLGIDDNQENDIMNGEIRITAETMREIFEPCVEGVVDLISAQITQVERARSKTRCIFLSGGFANSDHLLNEVRRFARERDRIEVYRGPNPQAAVLFGAVAKGMGYGSGGKITAFACPRHFGIVLSHTFASWQHSETDVYADRFDGMRRAESQMTWLVRKGDGIFSDRPIEQSVDIGRKFGSKDERKFRATLVACDEDTPPETFSKVPSRKYPLNGEGWRSDC